MLRQIHGFGFTPKKPVIMSWSAGVEELIQLDPEMRNNLLVGTNYYWTLDTPENKAFVEAFRKKNNGIPPGYAPAAGYALMKTTLMAMDAAKSTDPAKAVEAIEKFKGRTFMGDTSFNPKTHQIERPYFVLKAAMSLDGRTATGRGKSPWITGKEARADGRELRGRMDAILCGIGTVLRDDPRLTTRLEGRPDPIRIVLDSRLRTPAAAKIFRGGGRTIVATTTAAPQPKARALAKRVALPI